jgi:hypothetical protein
MPRVGFEHTIPAFEEAKAFHALCRAATVIGRKISVPKTAEVTEQFMTGLSNPRHVGCMRRASCFFFIFADAKIDFSFS